MNYTDIQMNHTYYYYNPVTQTRTPAVAWEKGFFTDGQPYVLINESHCVAPGNLFPYAVKLQRKTHCWNCATSLDSAFMAECMHCKRIVCPHCGKCHCHTIWR